MFSCVFIHTFNYTPIVSSVGQINNLFKSTLLLPQTPHTQDNEVFSSLFSKLPLIQTIYIFQKFWNIFLAGDSLHVLFVIFVNAFYFIYYDLSIISRNKIKTYIKIRDTSIIILCVLASSFNNY